jgi:hypothetical protein
MVPQLVLQHICSMNEQKFASSPPPQPAHIAKTTFGRAGVGALAKN